MTADRIFSGRLLDKDFQEKLLETFDSVQLKRFVTICNNLKKRNHTNLYLTIKIYEEPYEIYMLVQDLDLAIPNEHPIDRWYSADPSQLGGFNIV